MVYGWDMFVVSINAGAQVAIFTRYNCIWDLVLSLLMFGTGVVLWVELPLQRRLCPIFVRDVGSPDIHECFRGLTGSQRTCDTPRIPVRLEWLIRTESGARDYLYYNYILGLIHLFFIKAVLVPVSIQTISVITKIIYIDKRTTT